MNRTAAEFKDHVRNIVPVNTTVPSKPRQRPGGIQGRDKRPRLPPSGAAPSIKVGLGEEIITPPVGVPMAGYARKGVSTGVHDDLYVRSLVIEAADKTSVVMMTLGIINFGFEHQEKIRAKISAETGIPPDSILISCTHTHSGPDIGGAGPSYIDLVVNRAAKSAIDAWRRRVPGRVGTGSADRPRARPKRPPARIWGSPPRPRGRAHQSRGFPGQALGRRLQLRLPSLDPQPAQPGVHRGLAALRDPARPEGPGQKRRAAFFQSAQGDAKVGYTAELSAVGARETPIRNFWYAEVKGKQMAAAVAGALPGITTSANPDIRVASGFVDLPLRDSHPMTVKVCRGLERDRQDESCRRRGEGRRARPAESSTTFKVDVLLSGLAVDCSRWVEKNPNPSPVRARQYAARLGDGVFVTFPCEVFSEIGLKVKQRSPLEKTFVFGVAGGMGGYIPTAEEFKEGGYTALS